MSSAQARRRTPSPLRFPAGRSPTPAGDKGWWGVGSPIPTCDTFATTAFDVEGFVTQLVEGELKRWFWDQQRECDHIMGKIDRCSAEVENVRATTTTRLQSSYGTYLADTTKLKRAEKEIELLQEDLGEVQQQLKDESQQKEGLKYELIDLQQQRDDLTLQVERLMREQDELTHELKVRNQKVGALEVAIDNEMRESAATIRELERQLSQQSFHQDDTFGPSEGEWAQQLKDSEEARERLVEENSRKTNDVQSLRDRITSLQEEIDRTDTMLSATETQKDSLSQQVEQMEITLKEADVALSALQSDKKKMSKKVHQLEEGLQGSSYALQNTQLENQQLHVQIKELEEICRQMQIRASEAEQQLWERQTPVTESSVATDTDAVNEALMAEMDQVREQLTWTQHNMVVEIINHRETLNRTDNDLNSMTTKVDDVVDKNNKVHHKLHNTVMALNRLHEQLYTAYDNRSSHNTMSLPADVEKLIHSPPTSPDLHSTSPTTTTLAYTSQTDPSPDWEHVGSALTDEQMQTFRTDLRKQATQQGGEMIKLQTQLQNLFLKIQQSDNHLNTTKKTLLGMCRNLQTLQSATIGSGSGGGGSGGGSSCTPTVSATGTDTEAMLAKLQEEHGRMTAELTQLKDERDTFKHDGTAVGGGGCSSNSDMMTPTSYPMEAMMMCNNMHHHQHMNSRCSIGSHPGVALSASPISLLHNSTTDNTINFEIMSMSRELQLLPIEKSHLFDNGQCRSGAAGLSPDKGQPFTRSPHSIKSPKRRKRDLKHLIVNEQELRGKIENEWFSDTAQYIMMYYTNYINMLVNSKQLQQAVTGCSPQPTVAETFSSHVTVSTASSSTALSKSTAGRGHANLAMQLQRERDTISDLQQQLAHVENQKSDMQAERVLLQEQIGRKDKIIHSLNKTLGELRQSKQTFEDLKQCNEDWENVKDAEIEQLEQQLQRKQQQLDACTTQLLRLEPQLQDALSSLNQTQREMKTENQNLRNKYQREHQEIDEQHQKEMLKYQKLVDELEQDLQQERHKLAMMDTELVEHRQRQQQEQQQHAQSQQQQQGSINSMACNNNKVPTSISREQRDNLNDTLLENTVNSTTTTTTNSINNTNNKATTSNNNPNNNFNCSAVIDNDEKEMLLRLKLENYQRRVIDLQSTIESKDISHKQMREQYQQEMSVLEVRGTKLQYKLDELEHQLEKCRRQEIEDSDKIKDYCRTIEHLRAQLTDWDKSKEQQFQQRNREGGKLEETIQILQTLIAEKDADIQSKQEMVHQLHNEREHDKAVMRQREMEREMEKEKERLKLMELEMERQRERDRLIYDRDTDRKRDLDREQEREREKEKIMQREKQLIAEMESLVQEKCKLCRENEELMDELRKITSMHKQLQHQQQEKHHRHKEKSAHKIKELESDTTIQSGMIGEMREQLAKGADNMKKLKTDNAKLEKKYATICKASKDEIIALEREYKSKVLDQHATMNMLKNNTIILLEESQRQLICVEYYQNFVFVSIKFAHVGFVEASLLLEELDISMTERNHLVGKSELHEKENSMLRNELKKIEQFQHTIIEEFKKQFIEEQMEQQKWLLEQQLEQQQIALANNLRNENFDPSPTSSQHSSCATTAKSQSSSQHPKVVMQDTSMRRLSQYNQQLGERDRNNKSPKMPQLQPQQHQQLQQLQQHRQIPPYELPPRIPYNPLQTKSTTSSDVGSVTISNPYDEPDDDSNNGCGVVSISAYPV